MNNLIDRYVLGARVAPVAVVSFSIVLAISAWTPIDQWPIKLLGGSVFLGLGAFVLAQIARDAGKALEQPLWISWGGRPMIRMLRHRDTTLSAGSKLALHRHLSDFGIVERLPTAAEEQKDPKHADELYERCSAWLRRKALELKAKPPFDVVLLETTSYGYRRNILGIKPYGLTVAGVSFIVTSIAFVLGHHPVIELSGIMIVIAYLIFGVTETAVRRAAEAHSKRLLDAAWAIPVEQKERRVARRDRSKNAAQ